MAAYEAPAAFVSVMLQADAVPSRETLHAWMFIAADAEQQAQRAPMPCEIAVDPDGLALARRLQICDGEGDPSATTVVHIWRYKEVVPQKTFADVILQEGSIASVLIQEPDWLLWVPHGQHN